MGSNIINDVEHFTKATNGNIAASMYIRTYVRTVCNQCVLAINVECRITNFVIMTSIEGSQSVMRLPRPTSWSSTR